MECSGAGLEPPALNSLWALNPPRFPHLSRWGEFPGCGCVPTRFLLRLVHLGVCPQDDGGKKEQETHLSCAWVGDPPARGWSRDSESPRLKLHIGEIQHYGE